MWVPFSSKKQVYSKQDAPDVVVKTYTNREKMDKEHLLHLKAQECVPTAKLRNVVHEGEGGYICMERIKGNTIYELYGDQPKDVPSSIWKQIHSIVAILFSNDIHYIDITPYNFMVEESTGKVYVIDFGDAYICRVNWFLKEFLEGERSWNIDFA